MILHKGLDEKILREADSGILNVIEEGGYISRRTYGGYLEEIFSALRRVALTEDSFHIQVSLGCKVRSVVRSFRGDYQVNGAAGKGYESVICASGGSGGEIFQNFDTHCYSEGVLDIPGRAKVLILGTSLSAVDTLLTLRQQGHQGQVDAVSRTRSFPSARSNRPISADTRSEMYQHFSSAGLITWKFFVESLSCFAHSAPDYPHQKQKIRYPWLGGLDWQMAASLDFYNSGRPLVQSYLDATGPYFDQIWQKMDSRSRSNLAGKYSSKWSMVRHSMPARNAEILYRMSSSGQLRSGRFVRRSSSNEIWACFGAKESLSKYRYDFVVDATGGGAAKLPKFLDSLRDAGVVEAGIYGGVKINPLTCETRSMDGGETGVFVLGALARSGLYYVNSIEMIKICARRISGRIGGAWKEGGR